VSFDDILQQFATQPDGSVATWTANTNDLQEVRETKTREDAFLDVLWIFERDQRVYLGRAPSTGPDPSREKDKDHLRSLLLKAYLSTSRYRLFLTIADAAQLADLRRTIENVYHGLKYEDLLAEQSTRLTGTFRRIDRIRSTKILC